MIIIKTKLIEHLAFKVLISFILTAVWILLQTIFKVDSLGIEIISLKLGHLLGALFLSLIYCIWVTIFSLPFRLIPKLDKWRNSSSKKFYLNLIVCLLLVFISYHPNLLTEYTAQINGESIEEITNNRVLLGASNFLFCFTILNFKASKTRNRE